MRARDRRRGLTVPSRSQIGGVTSNPLSTSDGKPVLPTPGSTNNGLSRTDSPPSVNLNKSLTINTSTGSPNSTPPTSGGTIKPAYIPIVPQVNCQFSNISIVLSFLFSPPVLMHGGLICITFCLVCPFFYSLTEIQIRQKFIPPKPARHSSWMCVHILESILGRSLKLNKTGTRNPCETFVFDVISTLNYV